MWAYGEIGYHTGLMSRYPSSSLGMPIKRANFFLWKKQTKKIM